MTKLFHGTALENAKEIIANGFHSENKTMLWTVSDLDVTYFWNSKKMVEQGEVDNMHDAVSRCIEMAFESAQISAALTKSNAKSIIVLEYNIGDLEIEDDDSCQNMSTACKVSDEIVNKKKPVKMYAADFAHTFSGLYLIGLLDNPNIDLYSHLESHEVDLLNKLQDGGIYLPEEMMYPEWEEIFGLDNL